MAVLYMCLHCNFNHCTMNTWCMTVIIYRYPKNGGYYKKILFQVRTSFSLNIIIKISVLL